MTEKVFGGVNLSEWALQHRSFIAFLMIVCAAAGIWAYKDLGRSEDPTFTVKIMLVKAIWPGATIEETVSLVTDKLEKKLEEVSDLWFIRSETKAGEATIYVNLRLSVSVDKVPDLWYQVRKRVFDIWHTMPSGVLGPFFNDDFGETFGMIYALTGDGFSHREMRNDVERDSRALVAGSNGQQGRVVSARRTSKSSSNSRWRRPPRSASTATR